MWYRVRIKINFRIVLRFLIKIIIINNHIDCQLESMIPFVSNHSKGAYHE